MNIISMNIELKQCLFNLDAKSCDGGDVYVTPMSTVHICRELMIPVLVSSFYSNLEVNVVLLL